MIIKHTTFQQLTMLMKEQNTKVVVFGAGAIGTVTVPGVLVQAGLLDSILYYVDNDERKHGTYVDVLGRNIEIKPVTYLANSDLTNVVIFMTLSRYSAVIQQLDGISRLKEVECYMIPFMCMNSFYQEGGKGIICRTEKPVIPKVIHYMWLGRNVMPDKLKYCIESWHRYCPDYEIKCWNEDNYDIDSALYMKQAYEAGKYGFVPDYARVDILYRHGGIYLDTDVELKRNIDELLYQRAFCSVEKWQLINLGGCSGAVPNHPAMGLLLQEREKIPFLNEDGSYNMNTCGYYDTQLMMQKGYLINGTNQTIMDMNIYTYDYFHPYDYMSGRIEATSDTYAIHHFNGGWLDESMRAENEKARLKFEELYERTKEFKLV